jgi:hypothetical protein
VAVAAGVGVLDGGVVTQEEAGEAAEHEVVLVGSGVVVC